MTTPSRIAPDSIRSTEPFVVDSSNAVAPFVLAIDIGSTATRAALFDARAVPLGKRVKIAHSFTVAADGTAEIDPEQVVGEVVEVIDRILADQREAVDGIGAIALDTFASSLVGVDAAGRAVTPCFTYADSRCGDHVTRARELSDENEIQQLTGTRIHTSYQLPRLMWLRETQPDTWSDVSRWLALPEYLQSRLAGTAVASTPTAAWSGLLDRHTGQWSARLLDLAAVTPEHLPPIQDPTTPITSVDPDVVAARWPQMRDVPWFPGVPDGLSANVGSGASDEFHVGMSAATSGALRVLATADVSTLPSGLWCYRVDADRNLLGGAINDVGRVLTWLQAVVRPPSHPLVRLLTEAPSADVPLVLPFLTGERSTGWAARARATVTGLAVTTTHDDVWRGAAEGIAVTYARVMDQVRAGAPNARRIMASGRVAQDHPAILQIVADCLQTPIDHVTIKRTTLRGTAMLALERLAPDTLRAPVPVQRTFTPHPETAEHYRRLRERFEDVRAATITS